MSALHPVVAHLRVAPVESLEAVGVYARWSERDPAKFSLNYDQIEGVAGDVLVEHCRGLVLRQMSGGPDGAPGEYVVLARPFRRFYNLGQQYAAPIDWSTAEFQEKLDGTLCIVYHDGLRWCVATRSVPDADVPTADGRTFAQRFWDAIDDDVHGALVAAPERHTFLFELTAPDNQIVLPYNDTRLTCLAVIDRDTGEEVVPPASLRRPRLFRFATEAEAVRWVSEQPGTELEGLVVVDAQGRRVKVKNAQYLAVARVMTSAGSDEGLVSILLSGTGDDVAPWLPGARRARLAELDAAIHGWANDIHAAAAQLHGLDRKSAALAVQAGPHAAWMGVLMELYTGRAASVTDWLRGRRTPQGEISPSVIEKVAGEAVKRAWAVRP